MLYTGHHPSTLRYCIQFVPPYKVGFGTLFYSFNRPRNETERELDSRHSGSRLVFNHYAFLNKQDPFLVYLNSACTWAVKTKRNLEIPKTT